MADAVLIRGGTVVDETGSRRADVLVDAGAIREVAESIDGPAGGQVLDADGCIVAPGLVDLHSHLREPGDPEAETIESGARAGAAGGYTALVAMPNTEPATDSVALVDQVRRTARGVICHVEPAGCITVARRGEELAPLGEMAAAGVRIFTDDGSGVQDAGLMRLALEYARPLGIVLAQHCEDSSLAAGGHMHEGAWSSRLGVPGVSPLAEEAMVARDLDLVRLTGGRLHFLHLSTARSAQLVRQAKSEGLDITAEVAPHHLILTDEAVAGFDPLFKVNPPLRPQADVDALRAALADGCVDAVATDHAPHPPHSKEAPFAEAPPGMLGLETALPLTLEALGGDVAGALALLSWQPARIAGLPDQGRPVAAGEPANLCVFDPSESWMVDATSLNSRARNTPFTGRKLTGRTRHTVFRGEPVVVGGEVRR